jgi:hypothetical protein
MSLLADLLSPILASDFATSVKSVAAGLGLLPDSWVALDPEDAIVESTAETFAMQWNTYATIAIQGGWLETAAAIGDTTGPANGWIRLLASSVFNVQAIPSSFASGGWTGTNTTAGNLGPFGPGQLKFYNLDTNKTYTNASSVTFVPGANSPTTITADVIGSGSNAAPGRIVLLTTVLGLSGSNALAIFGLDAETAPALAARCRLKYYALSPNGPSQAYQYVALTPSLNGGLSINRVAVSPSSTIGLVTMLIASPAGPPVNVGDPAALQAVLYTLVVPDTAKLLVAGAVAHTINVTWTAYYHASANIVPATEMANGNAALTSAFALFPIGGDAITPGNGFVFVDRLISILGTALPKAFQIVVSVPGGDVAIAANEVPTLGTVPSLPATAIQVVS